jgi:hypothetical protein
MVVSRRIARPAPSSISAASRRCSSAGGGGGTRDRVLGCHGAGGENVALEMSVVVLCGADVGVTELSLDVHQRVAGGQPRRGRRVSERVKRHVTQGGVLERVLVPVT